MTTHRLPSNFLSDPSDKELIERSVKGLGSLMVGKSQIAKLAALVDTVAVCKSGHSEKLGRIEDLKKCQCGARWTMVKGERLEEDETEPTYQRHVKSDDDVTGGSLDGQPIMTSKRVRRPWTGTR